MVPISFPQENDVLDKPPGMSREECTPLNICRARDHNGHPVIITCWKMTKEEVAELLKTGKLWITIWGNGMPPIAATIESPFAK